jgi:hypothetical protein
MDRSRFRTAAIVVIAAIAIALVEAAGFAGRRSLEGYPTTWWLALRTGLGLWLTMAAATPIPLAMAARFPLERGRMAARLVLHAVAAVAFVTLHLALDIAVQTFQGNMRPEPFGRHLADLLGEYLAIETLVYAAVAGAAMFVRARREAESRARAAETLRAELGESKLAALQSQLAPHFLFNTLNAISTLGLKGETLHVNRALASLAELLRAVLDERPGQAATLADELAFVGRYLELQQLRFQDRLAVERSVEPETLAARVPWLLLQPLVENAVQHGLSGSGGGTVRIVAKRDGGTLVLEVSDLADGEARAAAGTFAEVADAPGDHEGLGLANTRARLAAFIATCGTQGVSRDGPVLDLVSGPHGATVRIRLPLVLPLRGDGSTVRGERTNGTRR